MSVESERVVLGIETATRGCSVALVSSGRSATLFEEAGRTHSERLLPMIEALLTDQGMVLTDLDGIAFGAGPGSFVGIRIGASVAHALALAAGVGTVPVSSLAALAAAQDQPLVAVAVDARMEQVYWGCYRRVGADRVKLIGDEVVVGPGEVSLPDPGDNEIWFGVGSGWSLYSDRMGARLQGRVSTWEGEGLPHAREVARLGLQILESGGATDQIGLPSYVRQRVAALPGEKL